ncbi:Lrp/AsnC family transcriptional regulator [Candidatus Woesearchaeota archaeon]|nr:Lrp/AsnC family transcriptional regulator [Candidatus Woesearchaeota archaeon]
MLTNKELLILSHLRGDSRKSLAEISRDTGIPISTIFDKLIKLEKGVIMRYVSLLDFQKLGYGIKVNFMFKLDQDISEFKRFLMMHKKVNSISRLSGDFDFLAECVFENMKELTEFSESLDKFKISDKQEYHLIDEIKVEGFNAR